MVLKQFGVRRLKETPVARDTQVVFCTLSRHGAVGECTFLDRGWNGLGIKGLQLVDVQACCKLGSKEVSVVWTVR